nr:hypothetical protein [Tanacetum cinerariifolium]
FWNTVVVKQSNDVTRLQALVDRKKVVIMEAAIRDVLRLDDAEGVDCLPNEEIFAELARMGYERPSTKLTFYKAFFLSQLKFLIHIILQSMSAKRTSWNEFSSAMASAIICLSTGKGFSGVETPLFEGMLVAGEPEEQGADTTISGDDVQDQSIPSPTPPTPPPQQPQDLPSTSQEAIDACAALTSESVTAASATIDAVLAAKITVAPVRVAAASTRRRKGVVIRDPKEESTTIIPAETKSKDKGKGIMIKEPKPIKKKQQVEMDEEYARKLHKELNKDID